MSTLMNQGPTDYLAPTKSVNNKTSENRLGNWQYFKKSEEKKKKNTYTKRINQDVPLQRSQNRGKPSWQWAVSSLLKNGRYGSGQRRSSGHINQCRSDGSHWLQMQHCTWDICAAECHSESSHIQNRRRESIWWAQHPSSACCSRGRSGEPLGKIGQSLGADV